MVNGLSVHKYSARLTLDTVYIQKLYIIYKSVISRNSTEAKTYLFYLGAHLAYLQKPKFFKVFSWFS